MKTIFIGFLACVCAACSSAPSGGVGPSKQCLDAQEIVTKHVSVGLPKSALLRFFGEQKWDAAYDKLDDAYYVEIRCGGKWKHVVIIKIWLQDGDRVARFKVYDAYTAP